MLFSHGLAAEFNAVSGLYESIQDSICDGGIRHVRVHACYEASSCGFGLQRALEAQGVSCEVVAPSSIPRRPGERVKTDRRDARKLATLYAAGLLTTISIPDEEQEAIRSLLRCRGDLTGTIGQTKQRILSFV